jgi:hypothetical protein
MSRRVWNIRSLSAEHAEALPTCPEVAGAQGYHDKILCHCRILVVLERSFEHLQYYSSRRYPESTCASYRLRRAVRSSLSTR